MLQVNTKIDPRLGSERKLLAYCFHKLNVSCDVDDEPAPPCLEERKGMYAHLLNFSLDASQYTAALGRHAAGLETWRQRGMELWSSGGILLVATRRKGGMEGGCKRTDMEA